MNLRSLIVEIKALPQDDVQSTPPKWWARAVHACFLGAIRAEDASLAQKLHASSSLRPFTVSSLFGYSEKYGLDEHKDYSFRIASLNDEISEVLMRLKEGALAKGAKIELDHRSFEVVQSGFAKKAQSPPYLHFDWAKTSTYEAISAPYLSAKKKAPRKIGLELASPTTFKSKGMHQPLPLASQVFGSLLNRWNAFAPITFPEEVRRYADECLAVSRFNISSRVVHAKAGALRVGSVGKVSYTAIHYDPYWMSIIALLADYAIFSGIGSGINLGMGQARRVFLT